MGRQGGPLGDRPDTALAMAVRGPGPGAPLRVRAGVGTVVCGSLLWHLQNTRVIDILGPGYHPVSLVGVARPGSTRRGIRARVVVLSHPGPDLPSRSALSGSEVARWG